MMNNANLSNCPKCHAPVAAGESFCTNCGATLTAPVSSRPTPQRFIPSSDRLCPRCGELNPVTEAFCSRCGAPTQPGQPTSGPQPVSAPPPAVGASRGMVWGIVAACFGILFLFVFFQVSKARQDEQQLEAGMRQWNAPAPTQPPSFPTQPVAPVAADPQPTMRQVACPSCGGTGKCSTCSSPLALAMGGGPGRCHVCHGTGKENVKNALGYYEDCTSCRGSGRCTRCGGTGRCGTCGGSGMVTADEAWNIQKGAEEFDRSMRPYQPPVTGASDPGSGMNYTNEDLPKLLGH
jgi:hypothetical protein